MGFNTVAVLYNDFTHELARDGQYGARIAQAMRNVGHNREGLSTYFGAGKCISQAHADYEQIVVVSKNNGMPISEVTDLSWMSLDTLSEVLRRHGYTVKKPSRRKAKAPPRDTREQGLR